MGLALAGIAKDLDTGKRARRARRQARKERAFIKNKAEADKSKLREDATREVATQRAQFGAAGVSLEGSTGLINEATLFATIEELNLLSEAAFLEELAAHNRQRDARTEENAANLSATLRAAEAAVSAVTGGLGAGGFDTSIAGSLDLSGLL